MKVKTNFKDKIVVIIGASSGIGRSIALAIAERGAVAIRVSRNRNRLASVSK